MIEELKEYGVAILTVLLFPLLLVVLLGFLIAQPFVFCMAETFGEKEK